MRDKHKEREKKRRQRARRRGVNVPAPTRLRGPGSHTNRFLAIDGEGGNINGRHEYTLLVAAGKGYHNYVHNQGEPLTTEQCLDFILRLPQRRKLISFFFNYDVTMILRGMDPDSIRYLIHRDARTSYSGKVVPCEWGNYELDWLPGKLFTVRDKRDGTKRVVYDTAGFFQSSLVRALEGWDVGDDDERAFIEAMKAERKDFTGEVNSTVIQYAVKECELLCRLMDLVYRESANLGFHLRTFSGAGSLANSMLEKWGVDKMVGILPEEVSTAAWHAYFGGRFEVAAIGEIPGPVFEYDINSAYPYAMQSLPCLACGEWTHFDGNPPASLSNDGLCVRRIRWANPTGRDDYHGRSAAWGPFPWRSERGSISYGMDGEGWYWHPEYRAAMQSEHSAYLTVLESWLYRTECDHKPFQHVPELYARRKEMKAEGHLGERVIKLGINSLYGKTAQTVGTRKFASPVWAGIITSTTRAMCMDAITAGGNDRIPNVIMVATDAVYSRAPLDLPLGDNLGEWEAHEHENMLIVQPGLYALNVGTETAEVRKTRGIRKTAFTARDVLAIWRRDGINGTFDAPTTSFVGLRRGTISTQHEPGAWIQEKRRISFLPRSKRRHDHPIEHAGALYLLHYPADRQDIPLSARYSPKALTEELMRQAMFMADDLAVPDPEDNPGHIEGFARSDIKD